MRGLEVTNSDTIKFRDFNFGPNLPMVEVRSGAYSSVGRATDF
jgi:hypothetical protein